MPESVLNQVGVVIIGRNEGRRLVKCFDSIQNRVKEIVYVDSGSTDDSVATSIGRSIHTIELDMAIPFTAARARNEGFNRLNQLHPELTYVQFVDGDCEVVGGWLNSAIEFLEKSGQIAAVCGRRQERFPAASVYNMLCDIEWDTPVGEAKACGGDAMMRVDAFQQVNGFRESLIAGEEPELCVRLRHQGWKIWRLDVEMTLHDAAMSEFSQWWKRSIRAGYAFSAGAYLHGRPPEQHRVKETRSAWIWGLLIPLGTISAMYFYGLWALVLLLSYPVQVARLTYAGNKGIRVNFIRALFLVLGKFPEIFGVLKFIINRILNTKARLIEYK